MAEKLRNGKPQMLFVIIATWIVKVARARHRRTFASFWMGNCFCRAVVPRTFATKSNTGSMAVRRLFSNWVFVGC